MTPSIPVIDLGPYLAGDATTLETLAARLRTIQEDVGFWCIVNHGIDFGLVHRAWREQRRFFALPLEEKLALRNTGSGMRYIPSQATVYVTSNVNRNTQPDLNECILLVRERAADHPGIVAGKRFLGPNRWPAEDLLPGYRTTMLEYYEAMEALGHRLLPLYARALGMPADFFAPLFRDPMWITRNQYYPAVQGAENQFGIAPHRDHGFLTLLPIPEEPGLQIRAPSGDWIDAQPVPEGIMVNTGEFLHRWSNGRFIATPHRVLPPRNPRYSIAFFFNPTWDTVATPLPSCVSAARPAQFEPMQMNDYLAWYVDRNIAPEGGGKRVAPPIA